MLLRDLALSLPRLNGQDARSARRILARPTDGSKDKSGDGYTVPKNKQEHKCFNQGIGAGEKFSFCLHWVTTSPDKSKQSYVDKAKLWVQVVVGLTLGENDFDFKPPLPDKSSNNNGPSDALDIYLTDLGGQGVYGYCTTDQPQASKKQRVSAYCVLDNDYSPQQFDSPPPEVNGTPALKITAAHEFFHAVQFAYDWKEARWLMEGSAVAMEDEIFIGINAALAFIEDSAFHQPEIPLDAFSQSDDGENFEYGAWLFFRYMSENYCRSLQAPGPYTFCSNPELIRRALVEASKDGVGALQAIKSVIEEANMFGISTFPESFMSFGAANYIAESFYMDGGLYQQTMGNTRPPMDALHDLDAESNESALGEVSVDHLANRYVVFRPGTAPNNGPENDAQLDLVVDLPPSSSGARAGYITFPTLDSQFVVLDENGDGQIDNIPFDRTTTYTEVVLVMSNSGNLDDQPFTYGAAAELAP
jgi:hypothetical protein